MKFIFQDRDGYFSQDSMEFSTLEEFVTWSVQNNLPRHIFIPPKSSSGARAVNNTNDWMIWTESDYD